MEKSGSGWAMIWWPKYRPKSRDETLLKSVYAYCFVSAWACTNVFTNTAILTSGKTILWLLGSGYGLGSDMKNLPAIYCSWSTEGSWRWILRIYSSAISTGRGIKGWALPAGGEKGSPVLFLTNPPGVDLKSARRDAVDLLEKKRCKRERLIFGRTFYQSPKWRNTKMAFQKLQTSVPKWLGYKESWLHLQTARNLWRG